MEYQASQDQGRLERIAARLAKDPEVLRSIKQSTTEFRNGHYKDFTAPSTAHDLQASAADQPEEVGQTR